MRLKLDIGKNYKFVQVKLSKFYIWLQVLPDNDWRVNCWGIGNWSGSSFFYYL